MAVYYVRSLAGGAGTGADWTNAFTTLLGATAVATNADTVYVSDDHAETDTLSLTLTLPTSPGLRILGAGEHVNTPPNSLQPSGTYSSVARTGNVAINFNGCAYIYGMEFRAGVGAANNAANIVVGATANVLQALIFDNCLFYKGGTGTSSLILGFAPAATAVTGEITLNNCVYRSAGSAGANNRIFLREARITFTNFSIHASTTATTTLFHFNDGAPANALIQSSDLSGVSFTNLFNVAFSVSSLAIVRDCKLPGSVVISTGTNPSPGGPVILMHNCDSADTHLRLSEQYWHGGITQQTGTLTRTGGATQADSTSYSLLMAGNANTVNMWHPLQSTEFSVFNTTVGSSMTATVEILRDSVTNLQDNQIWLEVQYLNTSGVPLGAVSSDRVSSVIASAADQTASSATWDTTGMANPNKQKLVCTFTPQEAGYVIGRVYLAANTSVYVDPYITLA